jgi:hypothetical protein
MPAVKSGRTLADENWRLIASGIILWKQQTDNEGPCLGIEVNIWERAQVHLL